MKADSRARLRQLYYGDNLDVLRNYIEDESVDLVYLDPPFNSNQDYNVLFADRHGRRSTAQVKAFTDTWQWGDEAARSLDSVVERGGKVAEALIAIKALIGDSDMLAYLAMMAPRLVELRRVLKPHGNLFLHCDPTASHYLKILLDAIFGPENFCNEIIWKRTSGHSDARRFGKVHDVILFYARSAKRKWNQLFQEYEPEYIEQYYRYVDSSGRRFMSGDLSAAGLQGGGYEYEWKGVKRTWRCPIETMRVYEAEDRIFYTKNGMPRLKRYLDESKGIPMQDVWADIEALRSWHLERLGYPTQKPEALLQRIIESCSDEGDVVLDPFCGCGTTIAVAERLNRQWIGIDLTHLALGLVKNRLRTLLHHGVESIPVVGEPTTAEEAERLAVDDPYQFQFWIVQRVAGHPIERKKGRDRGIDGRIYFHDAASKKHLPIIISVKAGKPSVAHVRDLRGVVERENAAIGVLLTVREPTKDMIKEAASAGFFNDGWNKYPRIQILTAAALLDRATIQYPRWADHTLRRPPVRARPTKEQQLDLLKKRG